MNSKIYQIVLALTICALPYLNFYENLFERVTVYKFKGERLTIETYTEKEFAHRFAVNTEKNYKIFEGSDSIIAVDGSIFWNAGTEKIRSRAFELAAESELFSKVLKTVASAEYPFYVKAGRLENAIGEFSSLYGEIRFDLTKMNTHFFDAALIEEFVHAYQAAYYEYSHGQCRKKDYIFALKDQENEVKFKKKMEMGFLNWRRFGEKHAYIESEAKLITWLVQHQCVSIPFADIQATDIYNSGASARFFISPYLNKRNCRRIKKTEKLGVDDDVFIEMEIFMAYQHAFVRHWRLNEPGSNYTKGKLRHRPEALQALCY